MDELFKIEVEEGYITVHIDYFNLTLKMAPHQAEQLAELLFSELLTLKRP